MLIGVVIIQLAQAEVPAGCFTALGIQLLNVNLAHVRYIGNIRQAVGCNDGFFIDPPVSVGPFDPQFFRVFQIYHNTASFFHYYNAVLN